jgi:hypothetical protein
MTRVCLVAVSALFVAAAVRGQSPGLPAEWDVKHLMDDLVKEARSVTPLMQMTNPEHWNNPDAGKSYVGQWKSGQNLIQYFATSAEGLARQPERLPLALETYFRMESMESNLRSLADGIRKYYDPRIADQFQSIIVQNSNNREKLKQYLAELSTTKEQEFKVADSEAQHCRGVISREAPGSSRDRLKPKRSDE